jgi:hypothetical protein
MGLDSHCSTASMTKTHSQNVLHLVTHSSQKSLIMLHSVQLAFFGLSALAVVGVWGPFVRDGGFDAMNAVVARHPSTGIPGLQHYPEFDQGLMSIVAFNLSAVKSHAYRFMVQFLANVAVIPVILCTEDSLAAPGSWVR